MIYTPNLNKKIGKGGHGKIYLSHENPRKMAVKVIKENQNDGIEDIYTSEFINLTRGHNNLLHLYEFYQHDNKYHIVMEYMDGIDLFNYIQDRKDLSDPIYKKSKSIANLKSLKRKFIDFLNGDKLSKKKSNILVKKIIKNILSALSYLHKNNIIHCDIKPENIRILSNNDIKLFDYTLVYNNDNKLKMPGGTLGYIAPEIMNSDGEAVHFDDKIDVWSLGITLYIMMENNFPFTDEQLNIQLNIQSIEELINNLNQNKWDDKLIDIFKSMIVLDPIERLSTTQILYYHF